MDLDGAGHEGFTPRGRMDRRDRKTLEEWTHGREVVEQTMFLVVFGDSL